MELSESEGKARSDASLLSYRGKKNKRIYYGVAVVLTVALVIAVAVGVLVRSDSSDTSMADQPLHVRQKRAAELLDKFPLIDGHNDLPWQYRQRQNNTVWNVDLAQGWPEVHTDIPRIRSGKLSSQFWAAYVDCKGQYKDAVRQTIDQIDTVKKYVAKYPDVFDFVTDADGIVKSFKAGKVSSLIGVEGGHSIDSSLGNLRMFYDLGVRYMTITHSCNTPWADNWLVDDNNNPEFGGLNAFGEIVIKEMNRIGMMVDLSHVSEDTMKDALVVSRAPIIFSHSSAYAVCNHNRNVRDSVLELLPANKGIVMINFYSDYINCSQSASIEELADHFDHIKNKIGIDYIGIGADYDGVLRFPKGLEDVSTYPTLFAELLKRDYTESDLEKLAGGNLLRVFRYVEKVRDSLASEPPYEQLMDPSTYANNTCRTSF